MPAATPERFIVWQNGAPVCMGRVQGANGSDITQATVSAVSRSIYEIDGETETLISGPTALTKTAVISDTLLFTHGWDTARDPDGFNFYDEVPENVMDTADTEYAVEYEITPTSGNVLKERFTGNTKRFNS